MASKTLRNPIIPQEVHDLLAGRVTRNQLLDIVRSQGRCGYSKLNKAGLVDLIFQPVIIYLDKNNSEIIKARYQTLNKNEWLKQLRSCPHCGTKIQRRNWGRHQAIHARQGLKDIVRSALDRIIDLYNEVMVCTGHVNIIRLMISRGVDGSSSTRRS